MTNPSVGGPLIRAILTALSAEKHRDLIRQYPFLSNEFIRDAGRLTAGSDSRLGQVLDI